MRVVRCSPLASIAPYYATDLFHILLHRWLSWLVLPLDPSHAETLTQIKSRPLPYAFRTVNFLVIILVYDAITVKAIADIVKYHIRKVKVM